MLKAEGIIKKYQIPGRKKDLLEALSGVSIELADNSITAIVGESGSGKSTLARILSYIELPDAGKVTLGQHRTIAEASAVESPIRQETIGFPAHFFARAHNFKPPGRACQPEADSPMRT